ncbi:hypothetical protein HNQ78_001598 [Phycisphaera mikurensis]|nr:hypothetical protein [Phycisphaera mikurensis]
MELFLEAADPIEIDDRLRGDVSVTSLEVCVA